MNRPRKKDRHLPRGMYFKHGRHWRVIAGRWHKLAVDLATALVDYGRLEPGSGGGMPALIDRSLESLKPDLKPNTYKQYRLAANKLKKIMGNFSPEQVKPKHIAAIKMQFRKTPNMANRYMTFLRGVFSFALDEGLIDSNPCIGVGRLEERKRGRYITDAEFLAARAVASPLVSAIMGVQFYSGQRIGDVLKIRQQDIGDEFLYVQQQKTGKRVNIKITSGLREALNAAQTVSGTNIRGLTLFHRRGRPLTYDGIKYAYSAAIQASGVPDMRPNDMRAKSLTDANRQGKDAQKLAGHKTKEMTETYIREREVDEAEPPTFGRKSS